MLRRLDLEGSEGRLPHGSVWRAIVRYWWLPLLGLLISGAIGYLTAYDSPTVYEAEAVVVAAPTIQTDDFGNLAETIFRTRAVLEPVADSVGLEGEDRALVYDIRAERVGDSTGLRIVARAPGPDLAAQLADHAAASFQTVATDAGLGRFSPFGTTGRPSRIISPAIWQTAALSGLGGAVVAVAVVLVLWFVRQPILSESEARREFPADASFSARVRSRRLPWRFWDKIDEIRPVGVGDAIWRAANGNGARDPHALACVLVGNRSLTAVADEVRRDATMAGGGRRPAGAAPFVCTRLGDGEDLVPVLARADVVVAMVSEGVPRQSLQTLDEEMRMTADDEKRRILVYVRG